MSSSAPEDSSPGCSSSEWYGEDGGRGTFGPEGVFFGAGGHSSAGRRGGATGGAVGASVGAVGLPEPVSEGLFGEGVRRRECDREDDE